MAAVRVLRLTSWGLCRYVGGTCFYLRPVITTLMESSVGDSAAVFNATWDMDIALSNISDAYVTSPVLQAYLRCVEGPPSLASVPAWLYYSFGPVVSIDSETATNFTTSTTTTTTLGTGTSASLTVSVG